MRREIINDELIEKFEENLSEGLPVTYVCDLLGITVGSYQTWMRLGEKEFNEGLETPQAKLFGIVKKAQALFIKQAMVKIKAGAEGWQGMAWWLERTQTAFQKNETGAGSFNENIVINSSIKREKKDK